jgi:hypothetical protein
MGHQVVWASCAVTNPDTNEETILKKGDLLPKWVADFTLFVLTTSGAVKVVDDPDPALLAEANPAEPVRLQEHPPLTDAERAALAGQPVVAGGPPEGPKRPAQADPKAAWVDYAAKFGADRGVAEQATKEDLMSTKPDKFAERFAAK